MFCGISSKPISLCHTRHFNPDTKTCRLKALKVQRLWDMLKLKDCFDENSKKNPAQKLSLWLKELLLTQKCKKEQTAGLFGEI